jgi:hypothetical protein
MMRRREFSTLLSGATGAVARSVRPAQGSRWGSTSDDATFIERKIGPTKTLCL